MSEAAIRERAVKRHWAEPGSAHDKLVRLAKIVLPAGVGLLFAFLAMAPLQKSGDVSFILDKKEVDRAPERMRVEAARYSGKDNKGQAFVIAADSAIQRSSDVPVVDINGMRARLDLAQGPATIVSLAGRYDLDSGKVAVAGPVLVRGPDGYRLATRDVTIDMKQRTLRSAAGAEGEMRLGRFTAGRLSADLGERRVVLDQGARLKIVQGAVR